VVVLVAFGRRASKFRLDLFGVVPQGTLEDMGLEILVLVIVRLQLPEPTFLLGTGCRRVCVTFADGLPRDGQELRRRIAELPGFGEMKIKALSAVLAKRIGIEPVREIASTFATLGDVDSREALEHYQALKREWKAKIRAEAS
jgi:hypothetical protein